MAAQSQANTVDYNMKIQPKQLKSRPFWAAFE
jgi:hypothetical protein